MTDEPAAHRAPARWTSADIVQTRHSRRRFKERTGLPVRAADATTRKAFDFGKRPRDLPEYLRGKLRRSIIRHHGADGVAFARVYNGFAYIFAPGDQLRAADDPHLVVVTVLPGFDETKGPEGYMFADMNPKVKNPRTRQRVYKGKEKFRKRLDPHE